MGYCISQGETEFFIEHKNIASVLKALKKLHAKHKTWLDVEELANCKTVEEAFEACRWEAESDDHDNICGLSFIGEKAGDDLNILKSVAPYVRSGSFIEMHGEDGALWRWVFDGKTVTEKHPKITW